MARKFDSAKENGDAALDNLAANDNMMSDSDQAHAFAQGDNIKLNPAAEASVGHEAAHVVQQNNGQVNANNDSDANDANENNGLENEADSMGNKAAR